MKNQDKFIKNLSNYIYEHLKNSQNITKDDIEGIVALIIEEHKKLEKENHIRSNNYTSYHKNKTFEPNKINPDLNEDLVKTSIRRAKFNIRFVDSIIFTILAFLLLIISIFIGSESLMIGGFFGIIIGIIAIIVNYTLSRL